MYLGKVCQWLTHTVGQGEQGLLGQVLIRAFQREPSLRSFTPDRLLEEGYEMKPEGKHCTTGKPRLSRQLRPPQGVNYTETDRHFRKRFSVCHKNKHSLTSLALIPACAGMCSRKVPPRWQWWAIFQQQLKRAIWPPGLCPHQSPIPFPTHCSQVGITMWSCPHFCRTPFSCISLLHSLSSALLPIHKPWSSVWHRFPSTASSALKILKIVIFSSKIQFRGKNRLTCIDD